MSWLFILMTRMNSAWTDLPVSARDFKYQTAHVPDRKMHFLFYLYVSRPTSNVSTFYFCALLMHYLYENCFERIFLDTHVFGTPLKNFLLITNRRKAACTNCWYKRTLCQNKCEQFNSWNAVHRYHKHFDQTRHNIRWICLVEVFASSKRNQNLTLMRKECSVIYKFNALTCFLENLNTTRFTVGFQTLYHTKWCEWSSDDVGC